MKNWLSLQSRWALRILYTILLTILLWNCYGSLLLQNFENSLPALPKKLESMIGRELFYEILFIQLLMLGSFLMEWICEKSLVIKTVTSGMLFVGVLVLFLMKLEIPKVGVGLTFFFLFLVVMEWTGRGWRKHRGENREGYYLWLMPFLLAIPALLLVLPTPEHPYSWTWVVNLYERAEQSFQTFTSKLTMGSGSGWTYYSGFSQGGGLFGNLQSSAEEVLELEFPSVSKNNLYLAGMYCDRFENMTWQPVEVTEEELIEDTMGLLRTVENTGTEYISDYLLERSFLVKYPEDSVFHFRPEKFCGAKIAEDGREEITYYRMNRNHELFRALLDGEALRTAGENVTSGEGSLGGNSITNTSAVDVQKIYVQYAAAPAISERTGEWLDTVIDDAQSDYEKLERLESALAQLTYNSKPGKMPKTVVDAESFLDYFLFEGREGYCVHFATAFALLARVEGIPVRYAQGYRLSDAFGSNVTVYSNMAHAWPEAYIDGVGWMTFEPTAGFPRNKRSVWETEEERIAREALQAQAEGNSMYDHERGEEIPGEYVGGEEILQVDDAAEAAKQRRRVLVLIGCITAGVLVLLAVLAIVDQISEKLVKRKKSTTEILKVEWLRNLQILDVMGIRRGESETIAEFAKRVRELLTKKDSETQEENLRPVERLLIKKKDISLAMFEIYERILYSTEEATEEHLLKLQSEQKLLYKILSEQKGKNYVFCRIFLYIKRARFF